MERWRSPGYRPARGLFALWTTLCVSGCSTRWSTTELRPPPPAAAFRFKVAGQDQWLGVRAPNVEGDSVIVWTPNPTDARRVPDELRALYWRGRVALAEVREIQVGDSKAATAATLGITGIAALIVLAPFLTWWTFKLLFTEP